MPGRVVQKVRGGRLALRWLPSPGWTLDLAGAVQLLHVDDSQYVTGGFAFNRSGIAPEPHDNDFANVRMSIAGKIGTVDLFSTTSWTTHEVDSILDASPAAALFGQRVPILFEDDRLHHVFNHEMRATGRMGQVRWMAGGSILSATTRVDAKLKPAVGTVATVGTLNQEAQEFALFGDLGLAVSHIWTVEAGARLFSARINEEKRAGAATSALQTTKKGISPSLAISAKPNETSYFYIRAASAFRPAGLSPFTPVQSETFSSDELTSIEFGGRWHSAGSQLQGSSGAPWQPVAAHPVRLPASKRLDRDAQ
jgi:iron complex outermembrane recepter protein